MLQNHQLYLLCILISVISVTLQSEDGITDAPLTECHWDIFMTKTKSLCASRCSRYFGFWDKISKKLICYHEHGSASPIEWTETFCKCGYSFFNKRRPGIPCKPEMEFNITTTSLKACSNICKAIEHYTYISKKQVQISYCGDSNKIVSHPCQFMPRAHQKSLRVHHDYQCQCAVLSSLILSNDTNNNITNEPEKDKGEIKQYTEKMCQMGKFTRSFSKDRCINACHTAKGFISPNSEELVCYHHKRNATVISKDKCQCGIKVNNKSGGSILPCVPTVIHTMWTADSDDCGKICATTTAFLFGDYKSPDLRITRCDTFHQKAAETFENLKTKILLHNRVPTSDGDVRYDYPCECGVGSRLPQDLNFKRKKYRRSSQFGDDCSSPQQAPETIAESSKSRRGKRSFVQPVYFYECRKKRKGYR